MDKKIVLGLSGGVDSAMSALLLSKQGWDVTCLWLDIGLGNGADAAAVAETLNLPFEKADIRASLERHVCAPFADDYLAGRTPLPCAGCNAAVKFPALLALAGRIGASHIATGHYARAEDGLLKRGLPANDQSYMLSRLTRDILRHTVFPLGQYEKKQVRAMASEQGIPVAHKPDSMEICFIPDGDYAAWLDRRGAAPPPGDFVDGQGRVLGRHKGIHHYTLGQRRGLGLSAGSRRFVSAIEPQTNRVVLSDGADLYTKGAFCTDLNWIAIEPPAAPAEAAVRLRHSKVETPVTLIPRESGVELAFHTPARAPTPGQLAVFYRGELVLGSGWISGDRQKYFQQKSAL